MVGKQKIVFDCERMKHPHTGLYHFCYQLGKHLLSENDGKELCFYTPKSADKIFGKEECYIRQNSMHKAFFPTLKDATLWHSTYQGTNYFPSKGKLKIVLTIHDLNFLYDADKSELRKLKYLEKLKKKIEQADKIVAISQFTLNDVRKFFDISKKNVAVIYNGCNIEAIDQLQEPEVKPREPFLFTIGTITDKKNFHVLPSLLFHNDFSLVIAGVTQSEEYKEQILQEAKKWKVADRVFFTGAVSENDKQWYLKNCTAFVFPSIAEGFGLPVVEAMYFGKPIILSTHTSLPEIGGNVCYYWEDFEPGNMQRTLFDALDDFHQKKPEAAIIERANFFNWIKAAKEYHSIYEELLK